MSKIENYSEEKRLQALRSYQILDSNIEEELQGLVKIASNICNTPISLINLIDSHSQITKSSKGVDIDKIPLDSSICQYAILNQRLMVVENTKKDDRFKDKFYVKGEPYVRFYAGAPLQTDNGYNLGTICVMDTKPRQLTDHQKESLMLISKEVIARFELIKKTREIRERAEFSVAASQNEINALFNSASDSIMIIDHNSRILRINKAAQKIFGYSYEEIVAKPIHETIIPQKHRESHKKGIKRYTSTGRKHIMGENVEISALRKDGREFPIELMIDHIKYTDPPQFIGIIRDITDRKKSQNKIKRSLQEKEVLLSEIHHRVKNNLAVINGLLQLESFEADDKTTKKVLRRSQLRINSIAKVHELLYKAENFNDIDFDTFVSKIIEPIKVIYNHPNQNIKLVYESVGVRLNVNQAIPCGLILNELITNACKHAFVDRKDGIISISLKEIKNRVSLTVIDNGKGLPNNFSPEENGSLGFTLITSLVKQLDASFSYQSKDKTEFTLIFENVTRAEHTGSVG